MRGPFTRVCDIHSEEITSSISESGHETLWCGKGHRVKKWYVVDADGIKVALAHLNSSPQILDSDMLIRLSVDPVYNVVAPEPPSKPCKRGHVDWYLLGDETRYRCRTCKQEYYQKNKAKLAKRYKDRRARLLAARAKFEKEREIKNV